MLDFTLRRVLLLVAFFVISCLAALLTLQVTRQRMLNGENRQGVKAGIAGLIVGGLLLLLSVLLYVYVYQRIEGVFFLFKSLARGRSEPARFWAAALFIAGAVVGTTSLLNVLMAWRRPGDIGHDNQSPQPPS